MKFQRNILKGIVWGGILLASSCSKDYLEPSPTVSNPKGLRISMGDPLTRSVNVDAILSEMRVYCFDRSTLGGNEPAVGSSSSYAPAGVANPATPFHHVVQGITRSGMTLQSDQMRVGKWDVTMIAHRGAKLTAPIAAHRADQLLMYTYEPSLNGGYAHEFYHNYCRLPEITTSNQPYVNTSVSRNVAKVRIVVERAVDIKTGVGTHTIALDGIPQYISWAGTLLANNAGSFSSDKNNFSVFPNGMPEFTKNVTFSAATEAGTYKSDTIDYIIPAYRGSDFWQVNSGNNTLDMNPSPVDTITKKMNLTVNFSKASGGIYAKTVTIPRVAQCNRILLLKVRMSDSNIEIKPEILDWSATEVEGNVGAAYLNVAQTRAEVYDGAVSRIYFWSNQPADSVYITPQGKTATDTPIADVNTIFDRLAGSKAANLHYDKLTNEGYVDICQSNTSVALAEQTTKLYLNAGGLKREIIVKRSVTKLAAMTNTTTYIGTFHRASQMGERIITWGYSGEWNAVVEGSNQNEVLIDRLPSPFFNGEQLYSANPGNPEEAMVSDWGNHVAGKGRIYFRIGWKSRFSASDITPARYATVVVRQGSTPGAGNIIQTLYLRQGERADYLMRPGDGNSGGGTIADNRSFANKFSPFNLTSPDGTFTSGGNQVALNGAAFVQYPSQAGGFFQWANDNKTRYIYSPIDNVSGWETNFPTTFWIDLQKSNETCPSGYRRPTDGSISTTNTTGAVANSELRQSLWLNPQSSSTSDVNNSVWGFYADGFFDRGTIATPSGSAVMPSSTEVAYVGRLFFNPTTKASIFFPAAGHRSSVGGILAGEGSVVRQWSSSTNDLLYRAIWYMDFSQAQAKVDIMWSRVFGLTVRCVENKVATISFMANGATGATPTSISGKELSTITIPGKGSLNKADHYFSGWSTTPDGTGTHYPVGSNQMPIGGEVLYARWLHIEELEEIIVPNSSPTGNVREIGINVSGGHDNTFEIVNDGVKWFTATKLSNNKLRLTADASPNSDPRESTITLAHNSDPNYKRVIKVSQHFFTDVPLFNYLVLEFLWDKTGSNDIDVAIEFNNNKLLSNGLAPAFDNKPLGYMFNPYSVGSTGYVDLNGNYKSGTNYTNGIIHWGGDANKNATNANGESVFINIPLIDSNEDLNRYVKIDAYNVWYQCPDQAAARKPITMKVYAFKGGTINYNVTTKLYTCPGGINVYPENARVTEITKNSQHVTSDYNGSRTFVSNFQKVATITYDKKTHKASVQWYKQ